MDEGGDSLQRLVEQLVHYPRHHSHEEAICRGLQVHGHRLLLRRRPRDCLGDGVHGRNQEGNGCIFPRRVHGSRTDVDCVAVWRLEMNPQYLALAACWWVGRSHESRSKQAITLLGACAEQTILLCRLLNVADQFPSQPVHQIP